MFSFIKENNTSMSKEASNPQIPQSLKQKEAILRMEQIIDGGNQIQTPNFPFFQKNIGNQNLFDAYHNQFTQKGSNANKLISAFQDLGLDVEYVQESDAQNQLPSIAQSLNQHQDLKKTNSMQEKLNYRAGQNITVSDPNQGKLLSTYKQELQLIKDNCKKAQAQLSSLVQYQNKFQNYFQDLILHSGRSFQVFLVNFLKVFEAQIKKSELNRASRVFSQNFRKGNDELQNILASKQYKIKNLVKENEQLNTENLRMHSELLKMTQKYQHFQEINDEYESMLAYQKVSQKRIYKLQQQNNELAEKNDCIQWNLKQAKKNLSQALYQNKGIKQQIQRKYQKIFEQTTQVFTKKIEAQTYYKMKHDYPFNFDHSESKSSKSKIFDEQFDFPNMEKPMNRINSSQEAKTQRKSQDYTLFRSANLPQSLPHTAINHKKSYKNINFSGFDSFRDQSHSGKSIESNERQAQIILNEIKMMKASISQTSLASSNMIDKKQSFSKLHHHPRLHLT